MNKFVTLAAAGTLLTGISLSSFAAEKSVEEMCKEQAKKEMIAQDKLGAYVKECVKKHQATSGTTAPAPSGSGK